MPVREGKMDCTTCHNPHGSTNVRMLKVGNSVNEALRALPRREARPVPVGACAGRVKRATMPRPARLVERADARRADADALPAVPRRHAASQYDLRPGGHQHATSASTRGRA